MFISKTKTKSKVNHSAHGNKNNKHQLQRSNEIPGFASLARPGTALPVTASTVDTCFAKRDYVGARTILEV